MRKLAAFSFSFSVAVFLAQYAGLFQWLILAAAVLAAVLSGLFWEGGQRLRVFLIVAGLCTGALYNAAYAQLIMAPAELLDGQTIEISAVVIDFPNETEYGARVIVRLLRDGKRPIKTMLYGDKDVMALSPGDRIALTARIAGASQMNGERVTSFTAKGIILLAYQKGSAAVTFSDSIPFRYFPVIFARALKEKIKEIFSSNLSPFMIALITGDRTTLSESFISELSVSGLSHTVAVSGMHISFLIGFIMLLAGHKKRAALIAIPIILLFMAVVGNTPSVVRAGIMQILLLLAPALNRENDTPTSISFALMVILLLNPFAAASIGLQLSFGAMAGILLFSGKMNRALLGENPKGEKNGKKKRPNAVRRVFAASLSSSLGAMVFTIPLVAIYFNYVSLIAPLSNLLTLWAVSFVFVGGLLAALLGLLYTPLGMAGALLVTPLADYLTGLIPILSKAPFAAVYTDNEYVKMWLVYVYLLLGLCILGRIRKQRLLLPAGLAAAGLCFALLLPVLRVNSLDLEVSVLDVGQGQSILMTSGKETVLVDCGGNSLENPGNIAAERMHSLGRSRLDLLVMTHYDTDHVGGLAQLLARVEILRLLLPNTEDDSGLRSEVLALAQEYGTEIVFVEEDMTLAFGEAEMTVFPPLGSRSDNEVGLAVLCSAGRFDLLITGDMSASTEQRLLRYATFPDIEMLVVGHHGSKYSTCQQLLWDTAPEIGVISVGRNNYGHPSQETLDRLTAGGIRIYRTDNMGTVTVSTG